MKTHRTDTMPLTHSHVVRLLAILSVRKSSRQIIFSPISPSAKTDNLSSADGVTTATERSDGTPRGATLWTAVDLLTIFIVSK